MKKEILSIKYQICQEHELGEDEKRLIEKAKAATLTSYSPYSGFAVGAAVLLENGEIISGSNQENAAYPSGTCAERCAMFYTNARYPETPVRAIAIAARKSDGEYTASPITPCGSCRQVLIETEHRFHQNIRIILYGTDEIYITEKAGDLLPFQFNGDSM